MNINIISEIRDQEGELVESFIDDSYPELGKFMALSLAVQHLFNTRTNEVGGISHQSGDWTKQDNSYDLYYDVCNSAEFITGMTESRRLHITGIPTEFSARRLLTHLDGLPG